MSNKGKPHRAFNPYTRAVCFLGGAAIAHSLYLIAREQAPPQWYLFAILTLLTAATTVRIPSVSASLSVSEAFMFTATLLFGTGIGTLVAALDGFIGSLSLASNRRAPRRIIFNTTATSLSLWVSASVFYMILDISSFRQYSGSLSRVLPALSVFTALHFILNSWLIACAISLEERVSAVKVWRDNFLWLSLNCFSGASVAILLVAYSRQADLVSALWIIIPLLLVSYLTYKTAMGRVEDANRHLTELNRLHLSTIETLAMAIDAKDQITHGHIRRVQQYAVALATTLGVKDENELKAIEAAALLHDMGKLAVPDYILNKPCPLTPAEHAKMRQHATVGADILSAIEFPYPVVPIVRHHHEAWDGSGYPAGLKGPQIPIGARILAVVDCFDALTSDRPYRPKLSEAAALEVIRARRGSLYDPIIVDTFFRVHTELSTTELTPAGQPALDAIAKAAASHGVPSEPTGALEEIAASSEEMLTLFDISRGLARDLTLQDAADLVARHLRRLVPSTVCVFYLYDQDTDALVAADAPGDKTGIFADLRIPLGQRLTGWVAANRQTVVNSDPVLDLGESARLLQPPLRSSISTPLVASGTLVGALTLYSVNRNAFSDHHRWVLEAVAGQVAHILKHVHEAEHQRERRLRDDLTGLPTLERFRQVAEALANAEGHLEMPCSILFVALHGVEHADSADQRNWRKQVLLDVVAAARRGCRAADILFQYREGQFLILLSRADHAVAQSVAQRVEYAIARALAGLAAQGLRVSVTTGTASAPDDGYSANDLLDRASQRAVPAEAPRGNPAERSHIH